MAMVIEAVMVMGMAMVMHNVLQYPPPDGFEGHTEAFRLRPEKGFKRGKLRPTTAEGVHHRLPL